MKNIVKNRNGLLLYETNYILKGSARNLTFSHMPSSNSSRCPVYVHFVGMDIIHAGDECTRYNSPRCGIEYIEKGRFSFWVNNKLYKLKPGDLIFLPPYIKTRLLCHSHVGIKKIMAFSGAGLAHICELLQLNNIPPQQISDLEKWNHFFESAQAICSKPNIFNIENPLLAYQILLEYSEFNSDNILSEQMRQILEWIEHHINAPVLLQDIAEEFHISISTLYRLFNRYMDKKPIEYISQRRMERAAELLQSGHFLVKEVASQLNYSSSQYFSAEFKKYYGVSPKKYINSS